MTTTLAHVTNAELTKLRSIRSTGWTLFCAFAVTVGLSALICWGTAVSVANAAGRSSVVGPADLGLAGITLGQLAMVVLGVLAITSEYATGAIRTTLVAVPQRWKVVTAKALALAGIGLAAGLVTSLTSFLTGQALLASAGVGASLGDPGVARAVLGGGLYLAATAMFGLAVGAVLRATAGAITAAIGVLLVLPIVTGLLPFQWSRTLDRYLPGSAGRQITRVAPMPSGLSPWAGLAVFCLWWVSLLVVGAVLLHRRDA